MRMHRIHQGNDGVEHIGRGHIVIHKKGLRHRGGVGHARGFYHHAVKLQFAAFAFGCQIQ